MHSVRRIGVLVRTCFDGWMNTSRKRRLIRSGAAIAAMGILVVGGATAWIRIAAAGQVFDADDAPTAPVVIVLGAQVKDGKPMAFLAGRLDTTARLIHEGKAKAVLVSGDGNGNSGDEVKAMTEYLVAKGVDPQRIVGDPYGLSTRDSCLRALETYGVRRALVVTQAFHVPRAVAICRDIGLDAVGINSECDCRRTTLAKNLAREWILARPKAIIDIVSGGASSVETPADDSLTAAL